MTEYWDLSQDSATGALRWEAKGLQCDLRLYSPEGAYAAEYVERTNDEQRNDTWEYVITNGNQIVADGYDIEGLDNAADAARKAFAKALKEEE